jgi:hypothetical protein
MNMKGHVRNNDHVSFVPTSKQVDDKRLLVINGWGHPWSRMTECKKIFEFIKVATQFGTISHCHASRQHHQDTLAPSIPDDEE